ncbi:LamB/YcsF family protein [Bacillus sp. B-TM1]
MGALDGFVKAAGGKMHHVKPHGALSQRYVALPFQLFAA